MLSKILKKTLGLTVIELLAVISIIAILFIILIPTISSAITKSKIAGIQVDIRNYEIALNSYLFENGHLIDKYGQNFSVQEFNKYLEKDLQFHDNISNKKNGFGIPYFFIHDQLHFKIYTVEDGSTPREYSIVHDFRYEGSYSKILGFDSEIYVVPYCNETPKNNGVYEYQLCNNFAIITKYLGGVSVVNIPSQIDGKDVVAIGHSTIYNKKAFHQQGLSQVTLPDTLKVIGINAFALNSLSNISIPNSVVTVGDLSFSQNRLTSVTLSNSLKVLNFGSFWDNRISTLFIPDSVEVIEFAAFESNLLTNLTLSDSLESIEGFAFALNLLPAITIPDSVIDIGGSAFLDNKITTLTIPDSVKNINEYAFHLNLLTDVYLSNILFDTVYKNPDIFTNASYSQPILHFR